MTKESPNGDSSLFYASLLEKALAEIDEQLGGKAAMVSAQMRVGADQAILNANIATLQQIIAALRAQGEVVFDQIPWLDINQAGAPMDYAVKFDVFWRGLISSGRITRLVVPEESRGTRGVESEIEYALASNIDVVVRTLAELLAGEATAHEKAS